MVAKVQGLGSAGICFVFGENTFSVVESASNKGVDFFRQPNVRQPIFYTNTVSVGEGNWVVVREGQLKNSNQGYIRKWCELITEKWCEEKTTAGG